MKFKKFWKLKKRADRERDLSSKKGTVQEHAVSQSLGTGDSAPGITTLQSVDLHSTTSLPHNHLDNAGPDSQHAREQITKDGLHILVEAANPEVDIIAVHGLGGNAQETWTIKDKIRGEPSCFWLKDLLPTDLPNSRIMTFGYDSTPYLSGYSSQEVLESHSSRLLAELADCRSKSNAKKRPIVFIGHSLGGLLIRNALVQSAMAVSDTKNRLIAIKQSTVGLIFFHAPGHNNRERPCSGVLDDMISLGWKENSSLETLEEKLKWLQLQADEFASIQHNFDRSTLYLPQPACIFPNQSLSEEYSKILDQKGETAQNVYLLLLKKNHEGYRSTVKFLKYICERAPDICNANVAQEPAESQVPKGFSVLHSTSVVNIRIRIGFDENEEELFLGRKEEIAKLEAFFSKENRTILVYGTSGVGKTMLIRQYLLARKEDFPLIAWIDARSEGSIRTSYVQLAQRLIDHYRTFFENSEVPNLLAAEYLSMTTIVDEKGNLVADTEVQESITKAVKDWLCRPESVNWLLVFDHVGEMEHGDDRDGHLDKLDIGEFFPESFLGHIIIISQHDDYLFPLQKLQLGPLKKADAVRLLSTCIPADSWPDDYRREDLIEPAAKLAYYLPRALCDAGAYMSLPGLEIHLAQLITNGLGIYSRTLSSIPRQLSFIQDLKQLSQKLCNLRDESYLNSGLEHTAGLSIELLRRGSLFANTRIPIGLLESGYTESGSTGRAVEALMKRGFVVQKKDPMVLRLNRGVYLWLQDRPRDKTLLSTAFVNFSRGIKMELQAIQHELRGTASMWRFEQSVLPHIMALLTWVDSVPLREELDFKILGQVCEHQGRYGEAERFLKLAFMCGKKFGESLPDSTRISVYLGRVYHLQNRYEDAEETYKSARLIKVDEYPKFYHIGSKLQEGLASIYKVTGRASEATQLYTSMLSRQHIIYMKTGNDSNSLRLLDLLAMTYQQQGKYEEAKMLYQRILIRRLELRGKEDAFTMTTKRRLGIVMQQMGNYGEAESLFKQVLDVGENRLGRRHPSVLNSIASLAVLYDLQGRWTEAEDLYREAFVSSEYVLGRNHPDTLDIAENSALSFQMQGHLDKAAELYRDALTRREQMRNYSNTMKTAARLAEVYGKLGDKEKFEELRHKYWSSFEEGETKSSPLSLPKKLDL